MTKKHGSFMMLEAEMARGRGGGGGARCSIESMGQR